MIFNKNQKEFPSEIHKSIWCLGIQILPLDITLPAEVRNRLPAYMVNSCEQMQAYFVHLLSDMYENTEIYKPLPCGINGYPISVKIIMPFIDIALIGEAKEDRLIISRPIFEKFTKKLGNSKHYKEDKKQGVSLEYRLKILERCGLHIERDGDSIILTNSLYPNMFYALCEMARITLKEKSSGSNSFTYCDFRKLCRDYKYDKYENALVFLNDEQVNVAGKLDELAKQLKMTRSVNSGHCAGYTVIYSYRKEKIMRLSCLENEIRLSLDIPYDKMNLEPVNRFLKAIENDSESLKKFFYKRIHRCRMCNPKCGGFSMRIFDKPNRLCHHWRNMLYLCFYLSVEDVPFVEKILTYNVKNMDEAS